MRNRCVVLAALAALAGGWSLRGADQGDKVYTVGKDGLTFEGKVDKDSPKVKVVLPGYKPRELPAQLFLVKLAAGKQYRISMDSKALDSFLVVQNQAGDLLAWDDNSGGGLNALLTLDVLKEGTFKIQAAFVEGAGAFDVKVQEVGPVTVHDGGAALKLQGDLGKGQSRAYNVKLAAGKTYLIDMFGPDSAVFDAYLRLLDASGKQLAWDDDSGLDWDAQIIYRIEQAATYQIVATNMGKGQGPFTLTVAEVAAGNQTSEQLKDRLAQATKLNTQAVQWYQQGQYAKAEPLLRQALDLRKEVLGPKHPAYASSLNNLALLYHHQGDYAKAEPLYRQALDLHKEVLGPKHPDYASSLNNLAALYKAQGDYAKAEPLYRQALDLRKEVLGPKHPDYASSLNNLATLYHHQGDYAKAEPLHRQALDLRKEVLGPKHPDYATGLDNLAGLYHDQGDYAKAEPLYRQALDLHKEVLGPKHPDYARSLNNLAGLYKAQGDYAKAEPLHRQALDLHKEVLGPKHPAYATSLNNLALLYHDQGDYAKAEPLYRQALDLRKEVLGPKHPDYATSLNNLALLYHDQGDYAKAEPLYRQALDALQIHQSPIPFGRLHANDLRPVPGTVLVLNNLAVMKSPGALKSAPAAQLHAADHSYALAVAVLDRVRQHTLQAQDSKIQLTADYSDLVPKRIRILAQLFALEQKAEALVTAWQTAEQGTARAFLESLGQTRGNALAGVSPKLQADEAKLLRDIDLLDLRIDKESNRPLDKRDATLVGQLMLQRNDVEAHLKDLVAQMAKEHPQYAAFKYPQPCSLEDARKCLADDEVALLFVPGTNISCLVLVEARPKPGDKSNGIAIFDLPGWATLTEQVAALTDPKTLEKPARVKALAREAFATLLGPCQQRLKDKHLVILPGGPLCFLPFGMLVGPDGKYLIEKHRIRYGPSLTALHFIRLWKDKRQQPDVPLFAVGDPVYEEAAAPPPNPKGPRGDLLSVSFLPPQRGDRPPGGVQDIPLPGDEVRRDLLWREGKPASFQRLVHSGKEVADIADLLKADPAYVLTRDQATKANVQAASVADKLGRARYVHFATHGILGLDKGKQPALVLGRDGNADEFGFLQMDEITALKLNADLVVLSACRTGQGRMHRGEGVTGLARAFLYAGSKGVVCSLWNVADKETADLMVDFYTRLHKGKGVSAAEALCEAQRAMIRANKAPIYWAPFILIGE
jgi:CHAT domain-containing protein/tetratricopeptide (TPR) repeat protein